MPLKSKPNRRTQTPHNKSHHLCVFCKPSRGAPGCYDVTGSLCQPFTRLRGQGAAQQSSVVLPGTAHGCARGHEAAAAPRPARLCGRGLCVHCKRALGCTASPVAMPSAAGFFEVLARQGWGRSTEYSIYVRRKIAYLNVSS